MIFIKKLIALLLLLFFLPFLIICMIIIRLETKGNPIFRQNRMGKGGKIFKIYKLRTMSLGIEPSIHLSSFELLRTESQRITHIGKFLRKFHIDELPQLLNIVIGDMVFIGPRPYVVTVANFQYYIPKELNKKPGLTGLWQVSKYHNQQGFYSSKLDSFYYRRESFMLDLWIILMTIKIIVRAKSITNA